MPLTVGQIAEVAGVTVRTLHHYDALGLLTPDARSEAGYRLYEDADCERLQEILFYRELGFGLEEINAILREVTPKLIQKLWDSEVFLGARSSPLGE